jgi:hypothetical protein
MKLSESYKLWHIFLTALPRQTRFTLGMKVDNLFTECLEQALLASYAPRAEKPAIIQNLAVKIDSLKFFLKVLWEIKALDHKKYAILSAPICEIGKMVGGWLKYIKT